jgi:hypothetical protein
MGYGNESKVQGKGQTFDEALRNAHREASPGGPTSKRIRVASIEVEPGDLVQPAIVVTATVVE